jgi:putative tryptophan/tyrosine transport system substrate-binding protein
MTTFIGRRDFITLLGGAAAAWPLAASAQQGERIRRIGILMGTSESDPDQKGMVSTFARALADLGWTEGTNIRIERRWAEGDFTRLRTHAFDLARLAPDAIFAQGTPATTALRQAAPATPLVFVMIADPISSGLVSSFSYPGGNITGFTNYEFSMGGKWLEILKEMTASVDQVAVVFNPDNPALHGILRSIEVAGPTFRIQVNAKPARNAETIERIIRAFAIEPNGGLLVLLDFVTLAHRDLIIRLAAEYRLPAVYTLRVFATSGGLISYGIDSTDLFRRGASYVDRILKGENPGELPVQAPTKFELVINLRTAKALGLDVPVQLQQLADEVIE